MTQRSIF